jgi:hypothetical protein
MTCQGFNPARADQAEAVPISVPRFAVQNEVRRELRMEMMR